MERVEQEIIDYIEAEILPKYAKLGGHTGDHIERVISRSLKFHRQAPELNINMVYVIAAYHDLGRLVDNDTHNIESAKMLRTDEFIKAHFSTDEMDIMAEAIEDHRSSLGHKPRSRYGELVSSADRDINIDTMLSRVYDYTKHLHPEMSESEILEEARYHLRIKYAPDGYAAGTMYFEDPDFDMVLVKVEEVTRSPEVFAKIMREHNAKRKVGADKK